MHFFQSVWALMGALYRDAMWLFFGLVALSLLMLVFAPGAFIITAGIFLLMLFGLWWFELLSPEMFEDYDDETANASDED